MALFEAMAAGVPIVATCVGGVPDVISNSDALLVPAEDPGALAHAIRCVCIDRNAAENRAQAARDRLASEFNLMSWLAKYATLYRHVQQSASSEDRI